MTFKETLAKVLAEGLNANLMKWWIFPSGELKPLGGMFHHTYLQNNIADLELRFGLNRQKILADGEQEPRLEALRCGFVRLSLTSRDSRLIVELSPIAFRRMDIKSTIIEFVRAKASMIDRITVNLIDAENNRVVKTGTSQVFELENREKPSYIPLITENLKLDVAQR